MSELKFELNCQSFELEATKNLFGELSLEDEQTLCDDVKALKQQQLEQDLEQLQRRQSIVYDNAQKQVAVLENLLKTVEPSWRKQLPRGVATQQCPAPQAYRFKDIYEHKKQQLLRQRLELERSQRQFRSRPMPNFSQVHEQMANRQVVHRITCAITPNVLKSSRNMLLKRRQKVEQQLQLREQEQLQQLKLRPKIRPVPKFCATPFRPANGQGGSSQFQLEVKPFLLATQLRAEQRKIFNAQSHQVQEARRREQEEQRKRQEQQAYQKQRQLATFRARPNPFKFQFEQ